MSAIDVTPSKRAYILAKQLAAMHRSIESAPGDMSGYTAHAKSYNYFLQRAFSLFASDEAFNESIGHLDLLPEALSEDATEFGRLRADSAILQAAVFSFFEFYSPQEEKRMIGFDSTLPDEA